MTKPKILLMAVYNDNMSGYFEEIGLGFITSFLRQHEYEVMLIGVHEKAIDYNKIVSYCPDIVGMTVYEDSRLSVYHTIKKIKQLLPGVLICVGGPLPTYYSIEMLKESPLIDFVIRGEGEITFLELVSRFPGMESEKLENIKGLSYRQGKIIKENENRPLIEDIDILPNPARDVIRDNGLKTAQISTSRGCKSKCSFCISSLFWKKWRGRSVAKVVDEIEYIVKKYGVTTFNFIDGSFEDPGPGVERIRDIARGIVERQLNISYFADLRAEFQKKASPELMELLKNSGLCGACVGVESGNEDDLRLYGKLCSLEDNAKIIQLLRRYEIVIDTGFINFNPYSRLDGLRKNIDFLEKYGLASNFWYIRNKYQMYKGTRLYSKVKRDSLLKEGQTADDRFHFKDRKIAHLYDYIKGYMAKIDHEHHHGIFLISYYTIGYAMLLVHLKRQLKIARENEVYMVVQEAEKQIKAILVDVNEKSAHWFRQLLALVENGWDTEKADEISKGVLNLNYIKKTSQSLNQSRNKLYRKLIKSGLDSHLVQVRGF